MRTKKWPIPASLTFLPPSFSPFLHPNPQFVTNIPISPSHHSVDSQTTTNNKTLQKDYKKITIQLNKIK